MIKNRNPHQAKNPSTPRLKPMTPGSDGGQKGSSIGNLQRGHAGATIRGKHQAKNPMAPRMPALKKPFLGDPYEDGGGTVTASGSSNFSQQVGKMGQITPVTRGLGSKNTFNKQKVAKTNQRFKGSAFRGY